MTGGPTTGGAMGRSDDRPAPASTSARWGWVLVALGLLLAVVTVVSWFATRPGDGATGKPTMSTAPAAPPVSADPRAPWSADEEPGSYAQRLLAGTNVARVDEGLPVLVWSECAAEQGLARATALVGADELTHAPMDDVMATCAVPVAAENLSRGAAPAQDVVDAWLASPGHRANLLDPDLASVGIACAREADDSLTCSQVFLG
ncbi:CAP domain-containing protein [Cellulomonas sp. H30R-01]|uniref:CAP domain-containing protein n=1 Tax=Cellulomonas sp. H30R-01 TaxID=2704467 RepID=UPI00138C3618|nr:CAP domain-containing protein [Cellulomonas sp. H30R-01]QHT56876.1 CAP domain-containing protein [Cellulomonas sp. H30R-01]